MKLHSILLQCLFLLTQFNIFCSSENLDNHDFNKDDAGILLRDTESKNSTVTIPVQNIFILYDHLEIINDFLKQLEINNLLIIISEDVNDGTKLANILSNNNRKSLENDQSKKANENLIHEIEQNYYLYYNKEEKAYIFVYPHKLPNEVLAKYLAKRTIALSKELSIVLTCSEKMDTIKINSTFQLASEIVKFDILSKYFFFSTSITFVPLAITEKNENNFNLTRAILDEYFHNNGYKYSLSNEETKSLSYKRLFEFFAIHPLLSYKLKNLYDVPQLPVMQEYIPKSDNVIQIHTDLHFADTDENFKSLKERFSHIQKNSASSSTDLSSLKGVLTFTYWLNSMYRNISMVHEPADESNDKFTGKFIDNLCNSRSQHDIVQLVCFMKYIADDNYNQPLRWITYLQIFIKDFYLQEKKVWFDRLASIYKNKMNKNETEIFDELKKLKEEISTVGGIKKDLMEEALIGVSDLLNPQTEHLCSPLGNGNYRLQIMGKSFILADILRKKYCPEKVTELEILALDKIIINADIACNEMQQIIIIAQKWEIVSKRSICLDGLPADNSWRDRDLKPTYTKSPVQIDGYPGVQGGSGGSFFGIADTIVGGENLYISSKGGRGGDGQNGADGVRLQSNYKSQTFHSPGKGGEAGKGGLHGQVEISLLNNSNSLKVNVLTENGVDGKAGYAGINSTHDYINIVRHFYDQHTTNVDFEKIQENLKTQTTSDSMKKNPHYSVSEPIGPDDFISSLKKYRKYVTSQTLETDEITYAELYRKINKNADLVKKFNTGIYVKELVELEDSYSLGLNKTILYEMFMGWKEGISLYRREPSPNEKNTDYQILYSTLHDMTYRRANELQENYYNKPIRKIDVFLKQSIEDGKKLRNMEVLYKLQEISNEFKEVFDKEIDEAGKLIDILKVKVEQEIDKLKEELKSLEKEVDKMIDSEEQSIKDLEKTRREVEAKLALAIIFTVFKVLLFGLSLINPACAVIGTVLSAGISVVEENFLDIKNDSIHKDFKIPEGVTTSLEKTFKADSEKRDKDLKAIKENLETIQGEIRKIGSNNDEAAPLISVNQKVNDLCIAKQSETADLRKCMINVLEDEEASLNKKNQHQKGKYAKSLKVLEKSTIALDFIKLGVERYNKIKEKVSALQTIDNAIEKKKDNIKKLLKFKDSIHKTFEPKIEQFRRSIRNTTDGFATSSRSLLEYKKFEMDNYLKNITSQLDIYTKQFKVHDEMQNTMKDVSNAMNVIIHMHTLIKEFRLKIRSAEYFKDISSAPFQITNIKNRDLLQSLTKLEQIHYSSDIIEEYDKLVIAIHGYSYPFVTQFGDFTSNLHSFFPNSLIKGSIIIEKMKHLESNLNKRRGHDEMFSYVTQTKFGNGGRFAPFYTWNNRTIIKDIFEGKEVKLFANIYEKTDLNAVKFRDIGIIFSSTDKNTTRTLRNVLNDFTVSLTHNGDSYYRCEDKVHLIKTGASKMKVKLFDEEGMLSFNTDADYVLSPFATWTISLNSIRNNNSYESLNQYVNEVNVDLVGDGQFMLPNATICNYLNDFEIESPLYVQRSEL